MRAKDQLEDFSMNLLESLNRIENKLDKESGSSKSGSHKPSDEKRKEISVSRHHQHSPRHSNKGAGGSSSTSPVRNHKRYGVDEL
jgi:retron-type reverse transcriptase